MLSGTRLRCSRLERRDQRKSLFQRLDAVVGSIDTNNNAIKHTHSTRAFQSCCGITSGLTLSRSRTSKQLCKANPPHAGIQSSGSRLGSTPTLIETFLCTR